jgi:hypothetical protein
MGTDFAQADVDFGRLLNISMSGNSTPCCGPQGCSPVRPQSPPEGPKCPASETAEGAAAMVLCPTCDEPFRPEFARRCGQCGHNFADGFDLPEETPRLEDSPFRIGVCLAAIILVTTAVAVYCWRLF